MKVDWTPNLEALFDKDLEQLAEFEQKVFDLAELAITQEPYSALQSAQEVSYYVVATRAYISKSLANMKRMNKGLNDKSLGIMKRHEQTLLQKLSRLTELREDILTLQKLSYTLRNTTY